MPDFLHHAITYIHGLPNFVKSLALIFSVALEYVFPPFPGDTIVLFAGFLNAYEAMQLMLTCVSIIIGTLLGSTLAYGIGRLMIAYEQKSKWVANLTQTEGYQKFGIWYRKWGGWFLLFNRFFPGIRALFFLVAGAEKVSITKVLILGGLSAVLYNACLFAIGYVVGFNADMILIYVYRFNVIALSLLLLFIALFLFWVWKKNRK